MSIPEIIEPSSITVKIHLPDDAENVLAVNFIETTSIERFKDDIAKRFKILSEDLLVLQKDEEIDDEMMLSELVLNEFGIVEVSLKLTDEAVTNGVILDASVYFSSFSLSEIITVHIPYEDEEGEIVTRDLMVEIENKAIKKPFVGGFVHKKTNLEYHHAFTQTGPTEDQIEKLLQEKCSRDTQTAVLRMSSTHTMVDQSTQNFGDANENLFFDKSTDIQVKAHEKYESFNELEKRKDFIGKVRLIQRNFRAYRLRFCVKEKAAEYRLIQARKKKREERVKQDYINSNTKSGEFPKTKKDFDSLLAQISTWKETETKRITSEFTGPTRVVEMQALLEKEIQLLNGIEKRRLEIQKELQVNRQEKVIQRCGEPIKWIGYRDCLIEMDTLKTQRARKLGELFILLREKSASLDDRMRLLNDISEALAKESSSKIIELENLFERERELLKCRVPNSALEILRKRELAIFLEVIKNEDHDKKEKQNCRICEKCKSVLPSSCFAIHSKQKSFDLCKKCASLKSVKTDLSVYRAILRGIQRDERKRGALSSLAFIVQETDIKQIIENIWHGISILSQCNITSDLRLPRWDINEEWSPWNCVCLTSAESKIHINLNIEQIQEIYGDKIIVECRAKSNLARSIFKHLKKNDQTLMEDCKWYEAGIKEKVV